MDNFSKMLHSELNQKILPVISITCEEELKTFLSAIIKADIKCVEITFRHPFAPTAISHIKKHYPKITVGAGTIVTRKLLKQAIYSGADFFVSPGFDEKIIKIAKRKHLSFLPGCSTPSDILKAKSYGFKTIKFFPAECSGGINALKLYQGAFPDINFIPTGGITNDNFIKYLELDNVLCCGGSFMISKDKLNASDSNGIAFDIISCISQYKEKEI